MKRLWQEFCAGFMWGMGAGIAAFIILGVLRVWIDQQ